MYDEAHGLAGRSDRAEAAAGLAERARSVVLLTATPHSGDEQAYSRLCSLGDLPGGFPLITFRRTRADVGLAHNRRAVLLRVGPTTAESAMHAVQAGEEVTSRGGKVSLAIGELVGTHHDTVDEMMQEMLIHERHTIGMYHELLGVAEGCDVSLEELARQMIRREELDVADIEKMLRKRGDA